MERIKTCTLGVLLAVAALALCACARPVSPPDQRTQLAEKAKGSIRVGVAWPESGYGDLVKGVQLAAAQINAAGGINGRQIEMVIKDDSSNIKAALKIARGFASDLSVVAVIGHARTETTRSVAITYQNHGMIYLSPRDTSTSFNSKAETFVFRTIPGDREIIGVLVRYFKSIGGAKVVIINDQTVGGQDAARIFQTFNTRGDIEIVRQRSYHLGNPDFRDILDSLRNISFDGVFLAGTLIDMSHLIKQAGEMGVKTHFMAGTNLNSEEFMQIAGAAAEETVVTTLYRRDSADPRSIDFQAKFEEEYHTFGDLWAAQGYDAMNLLADTMKKAKTSAPRIISSMLLHNMDGWRGVGGAYSFDDAGDVEGRPIFLKKVRNGKFEYLDVKDTAK